MHTYTVDNENRTVIIAILGALSLIITQIINELFGTLINTLIEEAKNILPYPDLLSNLSSLLFGGLFSLFVTFSLIFALVYNMFRKRIWKQNWIPSFVASAPDLTGEWEGFVTTDSRPLEEHIEEVESEEDNENPTDTGPEPENDEDIDWGNRLLVNTSTGLSGSWIGEGLQSGIIELDFENDRIDTKLKIDTEGSGFENGRIDGKLKIKQNWREMSIGYEGEKSRSYSKVASFRRTEGPYPELWYMFQNIPNDPKGSYKGVVRAVYMKEDDGKEVLRGEFFNAPAGVYSHGKVYFKREDVDNEEGEEQ